MVDYKKLCYLWLVEYVQVHQEYEPRNTIYIDGNVGVISLGPQYMSQGGFFFEILLTERRLQWSHWKPDNVTEDIIGRYNNCNTKGCPEDLVFGNFDN